MPKKLRETFVRLWSGRKVPNQRMVLAVGILLSSAILGGLILNNVGELLSVAQHIRWKYVWISVAASGLSYFFIALALREILGLLGHRLSFAEVFGIAFVSTTANYFVSSAGVSGFALKAHLLRKRQVPYGTTVTASVVSTAILYFVLAVIIFEGTAYLWFSLRGGHWRIMEGILGLGMVLATAVPLLMFFFDRELRGRISRTVFQWVNYAAYIFAGSEIPREDFEKFMEQLNRGLDTIHQDRGRLTKTFGYTCLDWLCMMLTLYYGFKAVGVEVSVGPLSAGFAVGQAATLIPILPGGLGAMEAAMAAVFKSLGTDWEAAMVASLIFRIGYYIVPAVLSVFLLWGLKVSEPNIIEETVMDTLPEELKLKAEELEKARQQGGD